MLRKYIPNSVLRQLFFITIALAMGFIIISNLKAFIPGFLGAFCLYVLMIHPLRWMIYKWKMNKLLSVILLMFASILVIVTPLVFLLSFTALFIYLTTQVLEKRRWSQS